MAPTAFVAVLVVVESVARVHVKYVKREGRMRV